jgi:hypothetical protein
MSFEKKYLKYKLKYLNLMKELKGGRPNIFAILSAIKNNDLDLVKEILESNEESPEILKQIYNLLDDGKNIYVLAMESKNQGIIDIIDKYNPYSDSIQQIIIKPLVQQPVRTPPVQQPVSTPPVQQPVSTPPEYVNVDVDSFYE